MVVGRRIQICCILRCVGRISGWGGGVLGGREKASWCWLRLCAVLVSSGEILPNAWDARL